MMRRVLAGLIAFGLLAGTASAAQKVKWGNPIPPKKMDAPGLQGVKVWTAGGAMWPGHGRIYWEPVPARVLGVYDKGYEYAVDIRPDFVGHNIYRGTDPTKGHEGVWIGDTAPADTKYVIRVNLLKDGNLVTFKDSQELHVGHKPPPPAPKPPHRQPARPPASSGAGYPPPK